MFMCVLLLRVVGSIILSSSPSQLPSPFKAEQQVSSYKCVFYHSTLHYLAVFGEDYESVTATTTFMPYYYMIQCTMLKTIDDGIVEPLEEYLTVNLERTHDLDFRIQLSETIATITIKDNDGRLSSHICSRYTIAIEPLVMVFVTLTECYFNNKTYTDGDNITFSSGDGCSIW